MPIVLADVTHGIAVVVLVAFSAIGFWLQRLQRRGTTPPPVREPEPAPPVGPDSEPRATRPPYLDLVVAWAAPLEERYEWNAPSRRALLDDQLFTTAVAEVHAAHVASGAPASELLRLTGDNRPWVLRIAVAVLAECDDVPESWTRGATRRIPDAPWDYAGLLALSLSRVPGKVLAPVLAVGRGVLAEDVADLIEVRTAAGEELTEHDLEASLGPSNREWVATFLDEQGGGLPPGVRAALAAWVGDQIDLGPEVSGLVTVWRRPFVREHVLLNLARRRLAEEVVDLVTGPTGRSVILVGEPGVGKTELVRAALDAETITVVEAQSSQINAGAMYVGQLEGRVEELARQLEAAGAVWVFPNFQSALFTGAHSSNPTGLIERLLPYVQRGAVRIVAETTPAGYASLVARLPAVAGAFTALRVEELDERETVQLCEQILDDRSLAVAEPSTLHEAHGLAQQFLPGQAAPGSTLRLLRAAVDVVEEQGRGEIELGDVYSSLAVLSGLPLSILDPSTPLGLDRVRAFFEERVLGQPEAIGVVVDRIALVKAGLTDPTRPLGVFLFVGPTGTGKTELAKAVAELVFGSPERLVRLDMSEYQTSDSLDRLLADADLEPNAAPLIASVRRRPFSVVLLDEFEKAAPPIRDLFLQLFDDGRLTDRSGRTTDFRRCLVVMTSNVGSALQAGPGVGFSGRVEPFRADDVQRALQRAFRPEFLNRIDRIVVFRPFDRAQMRLLLEKELDDVVRRRGMRDRPWAIEVDESAIDFLIEKGFTPTLGARPLKRAVETHVLTPLARSIAEGRVPTGDQFLFLSAAGGELQVRFVGLEPEPERAPEPGEEVVEEQEEGADARAILRAGVFPDDVQRRLRRLAETVSARVDGLPAVRKALLLSEIGADGFWERGDRFAVLSEVEYLDRLEEATRTAQRLADRLLRSRDPAVREELALLLAGRLTVLDAALDGLDADAPFEVALRVGVAQRAAGDEGDAHTFLDRVVAMYRGWAERCGMTVTELDPDDGRAVLVVSGLGAGQLLANEAGLHVAELGDHGDDEGGVDRVVVAVEVAGVPPDEPVAQSAYAARVRAVLDASPPVQRVTRRYRFEPAPLVRDAVRNYRTGRLDRVLAGDFDLY